METHFSLEIDQEKKEPIIRIQGEIDIYTCPKLNEKLNEFIANGTNNFTLDMQKVQYIDSTGLGIIAHAARNIHDKEGQITIICNQPQIRKIFEISGLQNKNVTLIDEEKEG
tara:strand:+ start:313 stop:648 length:336 start_codon:yes stop_codon:yes gene_type:complete